MTKLLELHVSDAHGAVRVYDFVQSCVPHLNLDTIAVKISFAGGKGYLCGSLNEVKECWLTAGAKIEINQR